MLYEKNLRHKTILGRTGHQIIIGSFLEAKHTGACTHVHTQIPTQIYVPNKIRFICLAMQLTHTKNSRNVNDYHCWRNNPNI